MTVNHKNILELPRMGNTLVGARRAPRMGKTLVGARRATFSRFGRYNAHAIAAHHWGIWDMWLIVRGSVNVDPQQSNETIYIIGAQHLSPITCLISLWGSF
jgi:hypothetical protein